MTLSWKTGGVLLGLVFFAAVLLVKPIGVSTQFVIADGLVWDAIDGAAVVAKEGGGFTSPSAYLAKYAGNVANPLNYSFVFVVAMMIGAALSAWAAGGTPKAERVMPAVWRANFGSSPWTRFAAAFAGGFVVLYGARLAGGCTSGHMMSGMMQTAVSGYIFAAGAFASAIAVALILYRREA